METIDLFDLAVRYLAVKPLKFDKFDFEDAQLVIKQDKQNAVTFIGEHGYFEQSLEAMIEKISQSNAHNGAIYVNIKGQGCSEKIKRKLFELSEASSSIIIFGNKDNWPKVSNTIKFSADDSIFADNHQRFFIYHSNAFNIALLSRHEMHDGVDRTEAIITNDPGAVGLLGITVGTRAYPLV